MNPHIQMLLNQAIQEFQGGNLEKASILLKKILQVNPKNLPSLNILGLIEGVQGNFSESAELLSRAVKLDPKNSSTQFNLAKALSDSGDDAKAIQYHKKAVELSPERPEIWLNFGKSVFNLGDYKKAIQIYERVLAIKPDYVDAIVNKGAALKELGFFEEAVEFANQAIALNLNLAEAWVNKGVALKELKLIDEANSCYERAVELNPELANAWLNRGNLLRSVKKYSEAINSYDEALRLSPGVAEFWLNKGITLKELRRYSEALSHYEKALSLSPRMKWLFGDYCLLKMTACVWTRYSEGVAFLKEKILQGEKVTDPFPPLSLIDNPSIHKAASIIYAKDKYPQNLKLGPIPKRLKQEKIRIGYFSPDFCSHPVSFLTVELFELHDRSQFEIFAFSLRKGDVMDGMRKRLLSAFDHFIDVDTKQDVEIAQLARELNIDIAIDLAGFTQDSRLGIFAFKAAPIQINWLGYPGTLGAEYVDFILADRIVIPEMNQKFYSEKVAYLPNSYIVDDSKRIPSNRNFTRQECGLPEHAFVFCCFNNAHKFNETVLDGWSRILITVKNSVLWIPENNEEFKENIIRELEKRDVHKDKIIFAKKIDSMGDHLARYTLADLFLDTYPYNAHTTALDSLKAGVPVITFAGESFASRVAASLLKTLDLPELIANSQAEYEALAIRLAGNPIELGEIKLKLANNRFTTPLFDTPLFTKHLEDLYIKILERYRLGLPPDHIAIA